LRVAKVGSGRAREAREVQPISTSGSTFHGMKKSLLLSILKEISEKYPAIFVDLDMSAAHTRIARYLLADPNSQLDSALKDDLFWATQITNLMPIFESANIELNPKILKKILKVGLYTSLNGGNPASPERFRANLNASDYIEKDSQCGGSIQSH
jgi:hypothetical protein